MCVRFLRVCVYIYVYIYIYTYIYVHIYIHIYTYIYMHIFINSYIYTCAYVYIYIHTHKHTQTHICTLLREFSFFQAPRLLKWCHTSGHVDLSLRSTSCHIDLLKTRHICIDRICTYMYTRTHTHTYMYNEVSR